VPGTGRRLRERILLPLTFVRRRTAASSGRADVSLRVRDRRVSLVPVSEATLRDRGDLTVALSVSKQGARCADPRSASQSARWLVPCSRVTMRYGILWLLGVPIPVLIIIYLMFHH
jgi:hypothetical protein